MDFQIVYTSGIQGIASLDHKAMTTNLSPLFDEILKLPKAKVDKTKPLQLLIANIDYDEYLGKLGIGRIVNGEINTNDMIFYGKPPEIVKEEINFASSSLSEGPSSTDAVSSETITEVKNPSVTTAAPSSPSSTTNEEGKATAAAPAPPFKKGSIKELFVFSNMGREKVTKAYAGDIVMVAGIEDITIGDTIMNKEIPIPLPPIKVEDPTVRMTVSVNKSPLAGREGKHLQSRVIRDRLYKELDKNVALKVYPTENADTYEICGRGQLHLTVLIESMRREGFELMIGPPRVIEKVINHEKYEPFEMADIIIPNEHTSVAIDIFNKRKAEMHGMTPLDGTEGFTQLKYLVPTRGMIGMRSALLTATKGTVVLDSIFDSYRPSVGTIVQRERGSLLGIESGIATAYGILHAQDRGKLFVGPRDEVFKDMIIGVHQRTGDLPINICKLKQLTNMRAASADEFVKISPTLELNLDLAVEYIQEDELVEVTPTKVRMLKNPDWNRKKK
jgi:GTP-binding protein